MGTQQYKHKNPQHLQENVNGMLNYSEVSAEVFTHKTFQKGHLT